MTHYICKTCGGSLALENGAWTCKYCGNISSEGWFGFTHVRAYNNCVRPAMWINLTV